MKPLTEQGYVDAQTTFGKMYEYGKGVTQDYKTAIKYYTLAADQGYAYGQYRLGRMYEYGKGVIQDFTRAHMWFSPTGD